MRVTVAARSAPIAVLGQEARGDGGAATNRVGGLRRSVNTITPSWGLMVRRWGTRRPLAEPPRMHYRDALAQVGTAHADDAGDDYVARRCEVLQ
jgi:hypothetical protein